MKSIPLIFILILYSFLGECQDLSIVRGRICSMPYSKLSIQSVENPLTATKDVFPAQLSDSGAFRIEADIMVPQFFNMMVDDRFVYQLFLCPSTETFINVDTSGLSIDGPTADFYEWRAILNNEYLNKINYAYYEKEGSANDSVTQVIQQIFNWRANALSMFQASSSSYGLDPCESAYFENTIKYAIYTYLWTDLNQRGHAIDSEVFSFWNTLPLDDSLAIKKCLHYNRALDVYIFWKLRLRNNWFDTKSFDYSSEDYAQKFYEQIIVEIENEEIRNGVLTRWICNLLFSGRTSARHLYERYLDDCSDIELKSITSEYYVKFIDYKDLSEDEIHIDTINISLFRKLKDFKGKVLYLDFWASWCSPCLTALPHTKKIQEEYSDAPFEVIFVNVRDNMGSFETTAKRMDLKENLIYLNYEESMEILDLLNAEGIPHYVLIDKNGVIVEKKAPGPESGEIRNRIEVLLD